MAARIDRMPPLFHHASVWQAIDRLAAGNKLTPSGLARKAGLDPTTFNKSKRFSKDGRERWPSTESLSKIWAVTATNPQDFFELGVETGTPPSGDFPPQAATIPLLGFAQAGSGGFFDDGGFPVGHGWEEVDFPAPLRSEQGIYALEVQGDSMLPLYRNGDVLIVEANADTRKGDRVVVKTRNGEVMAKVLVRRTSRQIELMSVNPEHENRTLEVADLEWVARIIWASQ